MVTHEQTISQCLLNEIDKHKLTIGNLKKEIDEWRTKHKEVEISKTDIENSFNKLKRESDKNEKEFSKLREEKLKLMQDILEIKKEIGELQSKNESMIEEIQFLKNKEIERIKNLDLDDLDLVSDFSKLGIRLPDNKKSLSRVNPLVPKLDFTKIFEWRENQNKIEREEAIKHQIQQELDEDIELSIRDEYVGSEIDHDLYEEPNSIAEEYLQDYPTGKSIDSNKTISVMRKEGNCCDQIELSKLCILLWF